jgi:4a-hydroxytetrahydrobiopterin dehydratase
MSQSTGTESDSALPRKATLNWRFEFGSYSETRHFLDQLADLSKRENFYPNINFGKTYANISIDADGQTELGMREAAFVQAMEAFAAQK